MTDTFEKDTAAVFKSIHRAQVENAEVHERLTQLLSCAYLKLPKNWFANKSCLDVGCGAGAVAMHSMLHMGAKTVCGIDLEAETLQIASSTLSAFAGRFELTQGSALQIPFADNTFDFVHCSGVLHHTSDPLKGFRELVRVTKPGGVIYTMTYGSGGVLRALTSALRVLYQSEGSFRGFIDSLNKDTIYSLFDAISKVMEAHKDDYATLLRHGSTFRSLIDADLILTIKDRLQAPAYHEHSEEEIRQVLLELGCRDIVRLSRYPSYTNIRRFLAPLYFDYKSSFATLLYGSGCIQLRFTKPF